MRLQATPRSGSRRLSSLLMGIDSERKLIRLSTPLSFERGLCLSSSIEGGREGGRDGGTDTAKGFKGQRPPNSFPLLRHLQFPLLSGSERHFIIAAGMITCSERERGGRREGGRMLSLSHGGAAEE